MLRWLASSVALTKCIVTQSVSVLGSCDEESLKGVEQGPEEELKVSVLLA